MRFLFFIVVMLGMLIGFQDVVLAKKKSKKAKYRQAHALVAKKTKQHRVAFKSPAIYGNSELVNQLNRIIQSDMTDADIAVFVKSADKGDTLYTRNINLPLKPASTLKVFTALASLVYLGPDYQFSTRVFTDTKDIRNGILQGNLYIVLSGDPTLTYYDLAELLLTLKSKQIHAIAGNVYIDNSAFDQQFYGPGWMNSDRNYCYGAPISASIINHNCLSFQMTPAKVSGHLAQVITSPKFFYPGINNSVITKSRARSTCSLRLSKDPNNTITIDGCLSKGTYAYGVKYVVTDVPEYNRMLFKTLLNRLEINVYGRVTFGSASKNLSLVGSHTSKPLRLLISEMLKKSDNIIAGALFKKLGQLYTKQPGSWENGSIAVSEILKQTGMNTNGLRVLDGSGLSHDNLATPAQLMHALNYAYGHHLISYEFISGLPIGGVDGTLKRRLGNVARKVRAKTGYVTGVVSLAGYVETSDKEQLSFVIMVNGKRGLTWKYKSIEDKIVTALTKYKRGNHLSA